MIQVLTRFASALGSSTSGIAFDAGQGVAPGFDGIKQCVWPVSGTFRNLITRLETVPGGTATRTFAFDLNGAPSLLTTIHSSAVSEVRDVSNDIAVVAGDIVQIESTSTNSPAASNLNWTLEFESTNPFESGYTTNLGAFTSGFFPPLIGGTNGGVVGTRPPVDMPVPCNGNFSAAFAAGTFGTVGSGHVLNFYLYKNGVKQDGTGGTVNTRLQLTNVAVRVDVNVTFQLPVVRGDLISAGVELTGTGYSNWSTYGLKFTAANDGESIFAGAASSSPSAASDNFVPAISSEQVWSTEQAYTKMRGGVTSFRLRDLYVLVDTAPGSSRSRRFRLRKNGAYPTDGPDVTISGVSQLVGSDLVGETSFVDGDTVGAMGHTPTNTPTVTGDEWWSMVMDASVPESQLPEGPGANVGITWVEFTDSSGAVHVWSNIALPDPSTYYRGWKEARVIEWGDISRSLSDNVGQYIGSQASWLCDDSDGLIRQLLYATATKYFYNRPLVIRTISDALRRVHAIPRTIFRGRVRGYEAK